jgi:hypothetical protein
VAERDAVAEMELWSAERLANVALDAVSRLMVADYEALYAIDVLKRRAEQASEEKIEEGSK